TILPSIRDLWIGRAPWGQGFIGRLDEVRMYDRALSATEVNADMNASIDDRTAPTIISTTPASAARYVPLNATLQINFSEPMDANSVTAASVQLRDTRNAIVAGTVRYEESTNSATFTPSSPLLPTRTYTATVVAGASGVKDLAGNALAANYVSTFISTGTPQRI